MRLLLDTHLFLWAMANDDRLPTKARELILEADEVNVSAASIWEIAIKARIGKLKADAGHLAETMEASGFVELPVTARHAARVAHLPDHHTDPFDRLLIAQATAEPLLLLTVDRQLAAYSDVVRVL
jgi:PIN domain nuclease of toxin-antitoxin system